MRGYLFASPLSLLRSHTGGSDRLTTVLELAIVEWKPIKARSALADRFETIFIAHASVFESDAGFASNLADIPELVVLLRSPRCDVFRFSDPRSS